MPVTENSILAGMQPPQLFAKAVTGTMSAGVARTLWNLAGFPGAGAYNATLNGVTLTAPQNGQIPFSDPAGGNAAYLARLAAGATQPGMLILADRIWHNGNYSATSTSAQNSTTPTWPSRSADGSTNGEGILLALEVSATMGAATPTVTVAYTNQAGTGSRSATNIITTVSASPTGYTYLMGLQAGDTGVRSVQSLTLSVSWVSGTMNLVAYRPLAAIEIIAGLVPNAIDALTGGLPRLYNGSVPYFMFIPSTTTTSNVQGSIVYTHVSP